MLSPSLLINDRYELKSGISRGGMGEVWVANDKNLERSVAVKFVNSAYSKSNPLATKVFYDEAKLGASLLGHPNVVTVLDYGVFNDGTTETNFLVMELVEGMNVAEWITNTKHLLDEETYYRISLLIAWEICRAIEYAHKKGIFHRDIKPLNMFLSKYGVTKVGDFGLARFVDAVTRTHTVHGAGSPAYAAPEQWKGEKYSGKTDIYQLGCTLYQLFTGRIPLEVNALAQMHHHLNVTPEPVNEYASKLSQGLSDVIMRCLSKEKSNRPDVWELNDAISTELHGFYQLSIDISEEGAELIDSVYKITDFDQDQLAEGEFVGDFPDFSEVLSEAIMLVLEGVYIFTVNKKINNEIAV